MLPFLFSVLDSKMTSVVSSKSPAFSVRFSCNEKWSFHFKQGTCNARENDLEQRKKSRQIRQD